VKKQVKEVKKKNADKKQVEKEGKIEKKKRLKKS